MGGHGGNEIWIRHFKKIRSAFLMSLGFQWKNEEFLVVGFPKILTHKVGGRIPLLTMARGRECPYTTHRATCDQTQPLPKQMGVQKK